MNAQRVEHIEVKFSVATALKEAVRGTKFFALSDGMAVRIDERSAYEPVALLYGGERLKDGTVILSDPIVVVEILSPGTKTVDTTKKLEGYFKLPSVRHYMIIDPVAKTVVHHARDGSGQITTSIATAGLITLAAIEVQLSLEAMFRTL